MLGTAGLIPINRLWDPGRGALCRGVSSPAHHGPPTALGPLHLLLCTFHLQQWLRVGNGDEALENAQVAVTYEKPDRRGAYIGEQVKGSRLSPELPPPKPESWQDESWSQPMIPYLPTEPSPPPQDRGRRAPAQQQGQPLPGGGLGGTVGGTPT